MQYDENDVQSLATCAYKEARGEGVAGMDAVMAVCINRVGAPGFAKTLHDVIYGKNQFTSMSVPTDPEFHMYIDQTEPLFVIALRGARDLLAGVLKDPTNGARWYANLKNVTSGWFWTHIVGDPKQHPITARIGRHTFFA